MMDAIRTLILFSHLLLCAFALVKVLRADARVVLKRISRSALRRESQHISWLLALLWATGLGLMFLDTGLGIEAIASNPKLVLKLVVVCVLTINGVALHVITFPLLRLPSRLSRNQLGLLLLTGSISSSHWLIAAFVGVARPLKNIPTVELLVTYVALVSTLSVASLLMSSYVREHVTEWQINEKLRVLKRRKPRRKRSRNKNRAGNSTAMRSL